MSDPSATSGVGLGVLLQSQQAKELSPEPYNYKTKTGAETWPASWTARIKLAPQDGLHGA